VIRKQAQANLQHGVRGAIFRFINREAGAAFVEFALVSTVVFLPLMMGVIEFGRGVWVKTTVTAAAREGARFAIVHGTDNVGNTADSAAVATYVKNRTQLSGIVVRPSWPTGKDPGDIATVVVTYAYVPIIKIFPSKTITSTSKQVISY
jgi:Flp pilus assembly protein TadG